MRDITGDRTEERTKIWKYYELGRQYNRQLTPNQYSVVETNTEFFNGNQWINLPDNDAMRRLAKPVFNIIKRVTSLFVASLTSSGTTVSFEPLPYAEDGGAAELAKAEVRNLMEKFKMDYRIRDALFDGAITGDYCAHFYFVPNAGPFGGAFGEIRGEIEMELLDGIHVMFGNPNIREVEKQPYIIIVGSDSVENLTREAKKWCAAGEENFEPEIVPDSGWDESGRRSPALHGADAKTSKARFLYFYTKKLRTVEERDPSGALQIRTVESVVVSKVTRSAVIFSEVDTGLSRYPIAWGNWQKQKNSYHGRALVTEVIPNQIFINQMMAMVFRHLQTQAFPTKLFNADVLPGFSNEVGTAIGVRNLMPGQNLGSVISTLPSADMSGQIIQAIDLCMQYTRECLGATDAQLGNLQATNTSAIMVLQNASEIPLENTRAGLHEWLEDIGAILLDMMGTYYGIRPVKMMEETKEPVLGADGQQLADPVTGLPAFIPVKKEGMRDFDFGIFKKLWFNVSVDVGAASYYSEIAMVQTLDNLRREGTIDVIDYLERMPDKLISRKQELIDSLKKKAMEGDKGT